MTDQTAAAKATCRYCGHEIVIDARQPTKSVWHHRSTSVTTCSTRPVGWDGGDGPIATPASRDSEPTAAGIRDAARQATGQPDADEQPDPTTADDPTPLRWGLGDVMWGDDDAIIVCLSGPPPGREPYWLELDPERAAALRDDLAGPDGPPATDTIGLCGYCGVPRENHHHGYVSTADALAAAPRRVVAGQPATQQQTDPASVVAYRDPRNPRVLLCRDHGREWHGVVPLTSDDLPDGGICVFGQLSSFECGRDVLADEAAR